jgi:putative PIN family toxin of toxin-antitoxin system
MRHGNGGGLLRAVVDTNVYVSAFLHPDRPIFQIIQQAVERRYRLLISPAIIRELGRVLEEDFGIEERVKIQRIKTLVRAGEVVTPHFVLHVITEDPPDNRILECAVAGNADVIVSGNDHLRALKAYQGIPIVRPVDFLRTIGVTARRQ